MCLIIQATKPEVITENMMNCAYLNNDDGFGLMFANKGKVHVHKLGKPKSFKSINKLWDSYKNLDVPMGLHFRFNTNGESSKAMSHPYQVLTKEESNRDIWLMHNGPQLPTPMIDSNKSDTHQFVKWILRPQLINEPDWGYGMGHYSGTPIYRTHVETKGNTTKNYVNPPRDILEEGTALDENDLYGMTYKEIEEVVYENPTGISQWLHDLVYNIEVKGGK